VRANPSSVATKPKASPCSSTSAAWSGKRCRSAFADADADADADTDTDGAAVSLLQPRQPFDPSPRRRTERRSKERRERLPLG
jgi:hypothetical protein